MTQFYGLQTDKKKFNGLGKVKQEVSQAMIHTIKSSIAECEQRIGKGDVWRTV